MQYVSIDIETLGLDPACCDTIEFGAVIEDTSDWKDFEALPTFHCYLTKPRNIYKGDAYAMAMHQKILKRIGDREEGYSYVPGDMLDEVFAEWLEDNHLLEEDENRPNHKKPIVVAGKNFDRFDLRFLEVLGFGRKVIMRHRTIDPGSMYFDPQNDEVPPGLEDCLLRAGIEKEVNHTAVEDALDVIKCVRAKQWNNVAQRRR